MRAVVTGASGFVGSHLTDLLINRGFEVTAMDKSSTPYLSDLADSRDIQFIEGDVRDRDYVASATGPDADIIFHLAAVVGVSNYLRNPFDVIDVNVMGTRNVLKAALENDASVVLASTSEVFGKNPKVPWAEDDDRVLGSTAVDRWSYSTSKATCEHLAMALWRSESLPVTIVRYFNAYGPRQVPNYVISRAIHRALNGKQPVLYDGGGQTRCFTYVGDIVEGTLAAGLGRNVHGETFNLGNPTETTVRQAIELVLEATGADLGWEPLSTDTAFGARYQDILRRVPDTSKASRLLDWKASTDLSDGIATTVEWARNHPEWLALPDLTTESAPTTADVTD